MGFQTLEQALERKHTLVFCGSGGVGKTSLAAATALHGALRGKRVLVVTIDPARRLADSLGLEELGNKAVAIDISRLPGAENGGSLHAMMLDMKTAADELIALFATSEERLQQVLHNQFYKTITESLAGSQEYVAMAKMYDLIKRPEFDTVVIDTAPTKYALDFFEAPTRMLDFLDTKIVGRFLRPIKRLQRFGWDIFRKGSEKIVEQLEKLVGLNVLSEFSAFIIEFEDMFSGMRDRSQLMHGCLQDGNQTILGIVCSANASSVDEAIIFARRLQELGMPLGFLIANRVHRSPFITAEDRDRVWSLLNDESALANLAPALGVDHEQSPAAAVRSLLTDASTAHRFARADQFHLRRLREEAGASIPLATIPFLDQDICDLDRLFLLGSFLFDPPRSTT